MKSRVPLAQLNQHLQGYGARMMPEYSNAKRHVYYSNSMSQYITVRKRGSQAELDFTVDCPCGYDD